MAISEAARRRLAGQWGSYDFRLIRDRHHVIASEMTENFLDTFLPQWSRSGLPLDRELATNVIDVRVHLDEWAPDKLRRIKQGQEDVTLLESVMFKHLHYGNRQQISFGCIGNNWKPKAEIAEELKLYRPWSVRHASAIAGGRDRLYREMRRIVERTTSPTEMELFDAWWGFSDSLDRPMLFPQVNGHTSGRFWLRADQRVVPLHFDFGLVNCETKAKIIVECDSRRYHSQDQAYQRDRTRQNVAEKLGWSVRRFTFEDVMLRLDQNLTNLEPDILPYHGAIVR